MQLEIPYRKVKFWFFSITNVLLIVADLLLTYIGTPDLLLESNPLVRKFGFGWTALILVNIIFSVLVISAAYICFIKYKRIHMPCKSFKEYYSMLLYGRPDKFKWVFYKMPRTKAGWMNSLYMCCFAVIVGALFARLIVVINWSCYLLLKWRYIGIAVFWRYKIQASMPIRLHLLIAALTSCAALFYWLVKEYLVNKKSSC